MWVQSLAQGGLLEEGMATHSSIFAWRIPRTEEGAWQAREVHIKTILRYHLTPLEWL